MLIIIAAHVAVIAAVMSAKMDLIPHIKDPPIKIDLIREDDPPPPTPLDQHVRPAPRPTLTAPKPDVALPPTDEHQTVDATPSLPTIDVGQVVDPGPVIRPTPTPVRTGARLLTSAEELKPPYPMAKLASGEEAVLRLRLTIDERGRVVAVEPVERADRVFLEAARRHLIAHWRYKPATEDGRALTSSMVITLRFQLDG
jgi:protein TonB